MKALVFDNHLRVVGDYPDPQPAAGEALIAVSVAGICNTDLEITRGYMDFRGVIGHEFVGIVEKATTPSLVGQRVVGEINCVCGHCEMCRRGLPTHCSNRTVLGIEGRPGALAEKVVLPERNLHVVPANVPDEEAVFTEPLAAALQVQEQLHITPTQRVVVLGDGKLGLLVAQTLAITGADVIALGRHPEKLAILESAGVRTRMAATYAETRNTDVVVECTGHPSGLEQAARLVRPRGTIVLKSTFAGNTSFAFSPLVVDEVTILGSRCGPFPPALRLLRQRAIAVRPMISATYPMARADEAFRHASTRGAIKILVKP